LATEVAFVMIVCVMVALSVVVAIIITTARLATSGVIAALLVGVLGLVAMDMARFTRKLRRRFLLGLVAFARRFIAAIVIAIVVIVATA